VHVIVCGVCVYVCEWGKRKEKVFVKIKDGYYELLKTNLDVISRKMAAIKHNGLSHQGSSSCSSNSSSNGSNNGSVMGDCHGTTDGGDSSSGFEWVGASCGQHGTYTLYKAVKLSSQSCHRRVLALGDFFFVKMWTDQEIVSIGELQLLWEDEKFPVHNNGHNHHHQPSSSSPLASLKLYFLPENTPDGRHEEHGEVP
jgi:hypothetical protein